MKEIKKARRFLAFALAVLLTISLMPTAFAASDFTDVPSTAWYNDSVEYVASHKYFEGTGNNEFSPSSAMTRAMFVTVLARLDGASVNNTASAFDDVTSGSWYAGAVAWAVENQIANGVGDNKFAPTQNVTRQDMASFMARYIAYYTEKNNVTFTDGEYSKTFTDEAKISSYAADAVELCVSYGLIDGYPDGSFGPQDTANRAQVAAVIHRLALLLETGKSAEEPDISVAPSPSVKTAEVTSPDELKAAAEANAKNITITIPNDTALLSDADITINNDNVRVLTLNLGNAKLGDLTISADEATEIYIQSAANGSTASDPSVESLTIDAGEASVYNKVTVDGKVNIKAVSGSTFVNTAKTGSIVLSGPGALEDKQKEPAPVVIDTNENVTVKGNSAEISVVATGANLTVEPAENVTPKVESSAASVTVTVNTNNEVTIGGEIKNVKMQTTEPKLTIDGAVEKVEVSASKSNTRLEVKGTGSIAAMDTGTADVTVPDGATLSVDKVKASGGTITAPASTITEVEANGSITLDAPVEKVTVAETATAAETTLTLKKPVETVKAEAGSNLKLEAAADDAKVKTVEAAANTSLTLGTGTEVEALEAAGSLTLGGSGEVKSIDVQGTTAATITFSENSSVEVKQVTKTSENKNIVSIAGKGNTVIEVKTKAEKPTGVTAVAPTTANGKGIITGVSRTMEYLSDEGNNWTPITEGSLSLSAGTYQVRVAKNTLNDVLASEAVIVTIPAAVGVSSAEIQGTPYVGNTLTAVADADATGTLTYVWKAGSDYAGTGETLTLTNDHVGKTITVTISNYSNASVTSSATATVIADKSALRKLLDRAAEVQTGVTVKGDKTTANTVAYGVIFVTTPKAEALTSAITDATAIVNSNDATSAAVSELEAALRTAISAYVSDKKIGTVTAAQTLQDELKARIVGAPAAAETEGSNVVIAAKAEDVAPGTQWVKQADNDTYKAALTAAKNKQSSTNTTELTAAISSMNKAITAYNKAIQTGAELDDSALTAAITAANANANSVMVSTDGADVDPSTKWVTTADKTTYTDAIDDARAVKATRQSENITAKAVLDEATKTFNKAKQDGTKDKALKTQLTGKIAAAPNPETVQVNTVAENVAPNTKWVTSTVKSEYKTALDSANEVTAKQNATVAELEAAIAELNKAIEAYNNAIQIGATLDAGALNTAIANAKANATLKISADGTDVLPGAQWVTQEIMTAYTTAISTAEDAAKTTETQSVYNKALADLNIATATFNNAKKKGTKDAVAPTVTNKTATLNGETATVTFETNEAGSYTYKVGTGSELTSVAIDAAGTVTISNIPYTKNSDDITVTVKDISNNETKFTIRPSTGYVAEVGDVKYTSLTKAIEAASNSDPVKLLDNVNLSAAVEINKTITLDLNGHTITGINVRALHVKSGTLTLTGTGTVTSTGSIDLDSSVIRVGDGKTKNRTGVAAGLILGKDVTVNAPASYGVTAFGDTTETVTIYGKVNATATAMNESYDGCAVATNGLIASDATINIETGAVITAKSTNAIYMPSGTLNVNGGTITGTTGIYAKSATVNVTGGAITGNGTKTDYKHYGNGGIPTGDALVIDSCGYPGAVAVAISGGSFTSTYANAVGSYAGNNVTTAAAGFITGGTFSSDPSAYVAEDYIATANNDTYTVSELNDSNSAAKIGGKYYTTLAAALTNAKSGDIITVLRDITETGDKGAAIGYDLTGKTLNLNGHTYSQNNYSHVFYGTGGTIRNGKMVSLNGGYTDGTNGAYALFIGSNEVSKTEGFTVENVELIGGINVYKNATGVTLENLTVSGTRYYAVWAGEDTSVTIKSGTYSSAGNSVLNAGSDNGDYNGQSLITVTGGTFTCKDGQNIMGTAASTGTLAITGGTFNSNPSTYLAENYIATEENGKYTISQLTGENSEAKIGTKYYTTLDAALTAATSGDTVTLLRDAALSDNQQITVKSGVTLTIASGATLDLTAGTSDSIDGSARALQVESGANLVINGTLKSGTADFSDVHQLGTMTINSGAIVYITFGRQLTPYVGNSATPGVLATLTSGSIASAPKGSTFSAGYTYTLNGTAEAENFFAEYGKDSFIIGSDSIIAVDSYNNLVTAISCTGGGTVKLGADISSEKMVAISKTMTLDLNGHSITRTVANPDSAGPYPTLYVYGGNLTLKDSTGGGKVAAVMTGSVDTNKYSFAVYVVDGTFTLESGTIEAGTLTADAYGVYVYTASADASFTMNGGTINAKRGVFVHGNDANKAAFTMNGGSIKANYFGIGGNSKFEETEIKITNGSIDSDYLAIYHPQVGTLTITGGTLTGKGGIEMKAGTATISGSTVIDATDTPKSEKSTAGNSTSGYAVAAVDNAAYDGSVKVTITGGTYNGAVDVVKDDVVDEVKKATISITGGTFSTDPSTYVVNNYSVVKSTDNNTYTVGQSPATDGETQDD